MHTSSKESALPGPRTTARQRKGIAHALWMTVLACGLPAWAADPPAKPATLIPAEYFVGEDLYQRPVLSPDGKHLAVITTLPDNWFGTVKTLAIVRLQDNKIITAVKMERFEVPLRHWWVSNTRLVVTKARDFGDDEKPTPTGEILTLELDGSGQDYLYGRLRGKGRDFGFGVVSGLPAKLNNTFYLTEFDYYGKKSTLYEVDSVKNTRKALLSLPFAGLSMLLDHQGKPRFATGYAKDAKVLYLKHNAQSGEWEPDSASSKALQVQPLAFNDDDSALYATVSEAGKPRYLVRQDIPTGARTVIAADPSYYRKLAYRVAQTIGQWRLKHYAAKHFWRWVCSWARSCRMPSDLGFDDGPFALPPLEVTEHVVKPSSPRPGMLFDAPAVGLYEERQERQRTLTERSDLVATLVDHGRPAVVWCHANAEGDRLTATIRGAEQIAGKTPEGRKLELYEAFASGQLRVLVIKPKIGAWGLNWQHCAHVVTFATHSYEQYYQSVRRCWRFGQQRPVRLDVVATEGEVNVLANLRAKAARAEAMFSVLVAEMRSATRIERQDPYVKPMEVPTWL